MEVIFEKPEYLLILFVIPIIIIVHFLTLKYTNRRAIKFANFEIIQRITQGQNLSSNFFLLFIRIVIILLFIFALSGITLSYVGQGSNFDFSLAIDSSNSMLIQDLQPNRLEAAKTNAIDFIDKLNSKNQISIVSFSGVTYVNEALTNDLGEAKNSIRKIEASETGGTALGSAIITSTNTLLPSKNSRVVILLTDGNSNTGVDVNDAIEYAKLKQVTIHTIGIGTSQGAEYTPGVNLTLDEEALKEIASETNGKYFKASSPESLANAYKEVSGLTQTTIFKNLGLMFTLIAIFLLIIEWVLFNTKYRTIP